MCQVRVFHKWVRWKLWQVSIKLNLCFSTYVSAFGFVGFILFFFIACMHSVVYAQFSHVFSVSSLRAAGCKRRGQLRGPAAQVEPSSSWTSDSHRFPRAPTALVPGVVPSRSLFSSSLLFSSLFFSSLLFSSLLRSTHIWDDSATKSEAWTLVRSPSEEQGISYGIRLKGRKTEMPRFSRTQISLLFLARFREILLWLSCDIVQVQNMEPRSWWLRCSKYFLPAMKTEDQCFDQCFNMF